MFKKSTDQHTYCQKASNPLNKTNILWHLVELSDNAASIFRTVTTPNLPRQKKTLSRGILL